MAAKVDLASVFDTVLPNVYIKKVTLAPGTAAGSRRGLSYVEEMFNGYQTNDYGKKTVPVQSLDVSNIPRGSKGLVVNVELVIKDRYISPGKTHWFENDEYLKFFKLRVALCKDKELSNELLKRQFTPEYLRKVAHQNKILEQVIDIRKDASSVLSSERKVTTDNTNTYDVFYNVSFVLPDESPSDLTILANTFIDLRETMLSKGIVSDSKRSFLQGNTSAERILENGEVKNNAYVYMLPNGKVWAGPMHYHKSRGYMAGAFHTSETHPRLEKKKVSNFFVEDYRLLDEVASQHLQLQPAEKGIKRAGNIKAAHDIKLIKSDAYIAEPTYSSDANNQVKFLFHIDYEKLIRENTQYGAIIRTSDAKAKTEIFSQCKIKNIRVFRHRVEKGIRKGESKLVEYDDRTELIAYSSEKYAGNLDRGIVSRTLQPDDVESEKIRVGAIKEIKLSVNAGTGVRTIGVTDYDMSKKTDGLYCYSVEAEIEDGTVSFVKAQQIKLSEARKNLTMYYNEAKRKENSSPVTGRFTNKFIKEKQNAYHMPSQESILLNNRSERSSVVKTGLATSPWLNSISMYLDVLHNLSNIKYSKVLKISRLLHQMCDPLTGSTSGLEIVLELIEKLEGQIKSKIGLTIRSLDEMDFGTRTTAFKGRLPRNSFTIKKRFQKVHDSNVPNNVGYDFLAGGRRKSIGPRLLTTEQYQKRMDLENKKYFSATYSEMLPVVVSEDAESGVDYTKEMDMQNTYFSYLTPAQINMGKNTTLKTIGRTSGLWSPEQYNSMFSSILASNPLSSLPMKEITAKTNPVAPTYNLSPPVVFAANHNPSKTSISPTAYSINASNSVILSALNVTISSLQVFENKVVVSDISAGLEVEEAKMIDPRNILGQSTKFATDPFEAEELAISEDTKIMSLEEEEDLVEFANLFVAPLINSSINVYSSAAKSARKIEDFSSQNVNNVIDQYFDAIPDGVRKKKQFVNNLPNQIKSIFLGATAETRKDWFATKKSTGRDLLTSPEMYALFYCLYQHINKIEVLIGYQRDDTGAPQIARPIWKSMTKEMFNAVKRDNLIIMCRMVPYINSILDFKKSPKLSMPEFDGVFLVGPRQARKESESTQAVRQTVNASNTSELRQEVYVGRLTEYSPLNTTGTKILRDLVRKSVQQDEIPSEFSSTAFVQQPRTVTRVGTRFTSDSKSARVDSTGILATQDRVLRPAGQTSLTPRSGGTSGASGGSGGMSGGGY